LKEYAPFIFVGIGVLGIAFMLLWYRYLYPLLTDRRHLPRVRQDLLPLMERMRQLIPTARSVSYSCHIQEGRRTSWSVFVHLPDDEAITLWVRERQGRCSVMAGDHKGSATEYAHYPPNSILSDLKVEPWLREAFDGLSKEAEAKDAEIRRRRAELLARAEKRTASDAP
jgi:hypothetical protein